MAYKYVDTGLATGLNDGSSFDNAWQSLKTALEAVHAAGDVLWVRRRSSYTFPASSIVIPGASDGTAAAPISVIGWPRTVTAIGSSDWVRGSTSVIVGGGGLSREAHQGRWIVAPDGRQYLVTRVVSATSLVIDRPYVGQDASGAAVLAADEDYAEAQAINDSAWTIKKTDWNADPLALPLLDFMATSFLVSNAGTALYWKVCNLDVRNGASPSGSWSTTGQAVFIGCLFQQSQNAPCIVTSSTTVMFRRGTVQGSGAGANQRGLTGYSFAAKDAAIYGMGGYGVSGAGAESFLDNVNIGVEVPNASFDVSLGLNNCRGRDVKLGGTNGLLTANPYTCGNFVGNLVVENYGKVLGANVSMHVSSAFMGKNVAVVSGSGDPQKRSGGADQVLELTMGAVKLLDYYTDRWGELRLWAEPGPHTFRLYCQSQLSLTPSEFKIRARYVAGYHDDSAYVVGTVDSDESVPLRTGAADWSRYVEVSLTQAVAGWVTLEILASWSGGSAHLYVDPKVVIL